MILTLRDRMVTDFIRLDLAKRPSAAQAALEESDLPGMVFDDQGQPITIVTLDDLRNIRLGPDHEPNSLAECAAELPPGIVVESETPLEDLVQSGLFTAMDDGARGVIVVEQGQVVGILPEHALDDFLADEFVGTMNSRRGTDGTLGGSVIIGMVIIYCRKFNHRNALKYYSRHNPPSCQNPLPFVHPLRG